jgi:hypothetical protein
MSAGLAFFTRVKVSLEGKGAHNNYEKSSWTLASAYRSSRGFLWSHPGIRADSRIPIEVNAKNQDAIPGIASGSPHSAGQSLDQRPEQCHANEENDACRAARRGPAEPGAQSES